MPPEAETDPKGAIKRWIAEKNGKVSADAIADDQPLIGSGILKSLQIMDLILWIERHTGLEIDVDQLKPGVFGTVDSIYGTFFAGATDAG